MIQDIRYGTRMLLTKPGFSAVILLTLALGIGVNTALFTVFNALVLKPLPITDVDSVVQIEGVPQPGKRVWGFSYPDYQVYSARTQTMEGLTLIDERGATLGIEHAGQSGGQSQREDYGVVNCQLVSANYFSLLRAQMALGRGFLPEEERTPGTHPVAVLSHYFWERAFKGDPQVIGQTIKLSGQSFVIVGVTAKEFVGTSPSRPVCWLPIMMRDALTTEMPSPRPSWHADRSANYFAMWGRLKPGVTRVQAQAELHALTEHLAGEYPEENRKASVKLKRVPGFVSFSEDDRVGVMLILPLSVGLVLLIAFANVTNLMLARAATRQKEIATRLALGATRRRIIRQLLTESLLIALAGGALGLLVASWTLSVMYPVFLSQFALSSTYLASFVIDLSPDFRVFGFTLLVAMLTGAAAGLAPALQASRPSLTLALKGEGSLFGEHLSQSRLRSGLVISQLAFSLVLLVSAGLLVRYLQKLQRIETGFDTSGLIALEVDLGDSRAGQTPFELRRQLEERLRAMPDVRSVSIVARAPLSDPAPDSAFTLPGQTDPAGLAEVSYDFVSPGYLETLGVPILIGRNYTEQEAKSGARVVVVSAAAARKLWPQFNDPGQVLGKTIGIKDVEFKPVASSTGEGQTPASSPIYQVIGVARDAITGLITEPQDPLVYLPLSPDNPSGSILLVRTRADVDRVMGAIRSEIKLLDPDATLTMKPTAEWLGLQTTPFRLAANTALALGLAALLLASIGLYGVMSFVVAQRTREIGIRIALGAESRSILALFFKQGMRLIGTGILLGLLGGAGVARLLAVAIVDISPFDPVNFGVVSLCLTLVALLATYLPARRATRVDSMVALRHD